MALFDSEFATPKTVRAHTAAWPKILGTASAVAFIGFVLLGIGTLAGIPATFAVVVFSLAGAIAAAGGIAYFWVERSE
jgi:lysozyme family protein